MVTFYDFALECISFHLSLVLFSSPHPPHSRELANKPRASHPSIHTTNQAYIHSFIHPSQAILDPSQGHNQASHIFEQPRQNKKKKKRLNILPKIIKNKRTFHKRVIKTAQIYANFYNLYVHFLLVPSLDSFGCCEGYCLPLCWFVRIIFTIYNTFSVVLIFSLPFL